MTITPQLLSVCSAVVCADMGTNAVHVLSQSLATCQYSRVCSAMQNLREAIAGYRGRLAQEGNDVKRNALLQVSPLPGCMLKCVLLIISSDCLLF